MCIQKVYYTVNPFRPKSGRRIFALTPLLSFCKSLGLCPVGLNKAFWLLCEQHVLCDLSELYATRYLGDIHRGASHLCHHWTECDVLVQPTL
jgi:hypothetical protein